MARAGGESDKLGNFYESIWTVDSVLDLLSEHAVLFVPEPLADTEGEGIEFVKMLANGISEYHSVKRQKIGIAWSLAGLARKKANGRSLLGDLFAKLAAHPNAQAVFVSQTGANELLELCDRARRCASVADWDAQLKKARHIAEDHKNYILPLCGRQPGVALDRLKRVRVVPFEEQELLKRVGQKTAQLIYRPNGNEVIADDVRHLLAEFVLKRLGQTIRKPDVLSELQSHDFYLREWANEPSLLSRVAELNESYLRPIRHQFINGKPISRVEAAQAVEHLTRSEGPKGQLFIGSAGLGKSCVMTEAVGHLIKKGVPVLCFRLDNLPHVVNTQNLGREHGLPTSPAIVLSGIANGAICVLVIDQLDALSLVSGRNDHLWPVFHQLLEEAGRVPNMRLLLACRAFDLQHDSRLRSLTGAGKLASSIELSLLTVAQVQTAVGAAGGDLQQLDAQQIELLRTPFNLQLFLEGNPEDHASFRSVKDLFDRFWDRKAASIVPELKEGRAWNECISTLAQELSMGASSAPIDVLDRHSEDAKKLASHEVIALENRRWRFFHESFGDYAFARQFSREGRDLVKFLTEEGGEQHLYRRAQVRQILTYERDRDRVAYIRSLRSLMAASEVRLHIKKLALEWLSQVSNPCQVEWQVVEALLNDEVLGPHAFSLLWDRVPWFDLLNRLGVWPKLLAVDHRRLGDQCARMLGMEVMMRERSAVIASLYAPYRLDMPKWKHRFETLFHFGGVHHSREIFDLALDCVDDGFFDNLHPDNILIHRLCENQPGYAAEFFGRYLDRLCVLAKQRDQTNPFADKNVNRSIRDFEIRSVAEKVPLVFVREIAPRLEKLIVANALPAENGEVRDKIWRFLTFGAEHDVDDTLLFSTARALQKVARDSPAVVNDLTKAWQDLPHRTIQFLLSRAWAGNGMEFGDRAAAYLIANPKSLTLGYDMMIGAYGEPTAAVSRALLEAISPYCTADLIGGLETAIRAIHVAGGGEDAKRKRYLELALLKCLPTGRLSLESRQRVIELEAEFPSVVFGQVQTGNFGFVQRALPGVDFISLSNDQWLELFKKYNKDEAQWHENGRIIEVFDIIGPLRTSASAEPKRFAALTEKMGDDVLPTYYSTIQQAIGDDENAAQIGRREPPLELEALFKVVARLHSLPNRPCGQAICRILYRIADKELPTEMIDVIGHYALHDPDPAPDCDEREPDHLVNHAINTARGTAVDAIARLLFAHPDLTPRFLPILEQLSNDPSASVRAVTIAALMALLNRDRESAVRLFCKICASDLRIRASHHVEDFIYHATFTHYAALQSQLREMLGSTDEEAKGIAARQLCLAAFRHATAEADLALVLEGDGVCRRAAAQVYAENHLHPSIRIKCEKYLLPLLDDSDREVRRTAGYWLTNLGKVVAAGDWTFFHQYLDSKAFAEEPGICLHELQEIPAIPAEVTLRLASHAIELSKLDLSAEPAKAYRFASGTPTLVVRLYHQTDDEPMKTRCLDLLDSMLALGWNEAAIEMAKAER